MQAAGVPGGRGLSRWLVGGAMALLAFVFFFPMIWMVLSSFKSDSAIFRSPFALPDSIDLAVWAEAWEVGHLGEYAVNSAIVTGISVTAILVIGASAAY